MNPYRTEPERTIEDWRPIVVTGEVRIEGRLDTQRHPAAWITSAVLDCLGRPMRAEYHADLDLFDRGWSCGP